MGPPKPIFNHEKILKIAKNPIDYTNSSFIFVPFLAFGHGRASTLKYLIIVLGGTHHRYLKVRLIRDGVREGVRKGGTPY